MEHRKLMNNIVTSELLYLYFLSLYENLPYNNNNNNNNNNNAKLKKFESWSLHF